MKGNSKRTLVLSKNDIQEIILHNGLNRIMDMTIERLESAILSFSENETDIPSRAGFHYELPQSGLVEWMPLYQKGHQVMIKVVGYHPANPETYGFPTIVSTMYAYDTNTGHLMGITDGVILTALRTGAASAIASKYLANPDSKVMGMIGCGAQAVTQLHALSRLFKIERVLIFDTDHDAMHSFNERCETLDLGINAELSDIETIVKEAEILCTATSIDVGSGPLFDRLTTRSYLHINAVGSDFPGKVELPKSLLMESFVCPDFIDQALKEGECQQLEQADIGPSIIEVVKSPADFTHVKNQRSVFDSTGWALEDQVVMELFLDLGKKLGLGVEIEIESLSEDAKNPYHFLNKEILKSLS